MKLLDKNNKKWYNSSVLPELGEENANQIVFPDHVVKALRGKGTIETKAQYLEKLILSKDYERISLRKQCNDFKGSHDFVIILNRFISHYERCIHKFSDVYYYGKIIQTRQLLKNIFLDNKIKRPAVERLRRIENMMIEAIRPLQKERLKMLENIIENHGGHEFEESEYARLLSIKESKAFMDEIKKFTEIDYYEIYKLIFKDKELFTKLSQGLVLPENIEQIIELTRENLEKSFISYEDCAPL